jgi:hydrogenase nickel incorporation protein HypA/HybF
MLMHEMMIAQSLLELILAEAQNHKARPVAVKISCGPFDAINDEVLSFAFESLARGTVCDGMKLVMEHKPIRGKCNNCNKIFEFELLSPKCPDCSSDFELLPDEPLLLETIDFQTE